MIHPNGMMRWYRFLIIIGAHLRDSNRHWTLITLFVRLVHSYPTCFLGLQKHTVYSFDKTIDDCSQNNSNRFRQQIKKFNKTRPIVWLHSWTMYLPNMNDAVDPDITRDDKNKNALILRRSWVKKTVTIQETYDSRVGNQACRTSEDS